MNDLELLQRSAKAAGIDTYGMSLMEGGYLYGENRVWAPLTDDGDALRLAVKLHLEIDHNHPMDNDAWVMVRTNGRLDGQTEEIDGEAGRAAATRRAIVRAAAALSSPSQGTKT